MNCAHPRRRRPEYAAPLVPSSHSRTGTENPVFGRSRMLRGRFALFAITLFVDSQIRIGREAEGRLPQRATPKSTGIDSSRRTRTGHHLVARILQSCNGLFAPHGRELMQEFLEGIAGFEIVEKRLNRHSRANEDRRSAEPIWVAMDHVLRETRRGRHLNQSTSARFGVDNAN